MTPPKTGYIVEILGRHGKRQGEYHTGGTFDGPSLGPAESATIFFVRKDASRVAKHYLDEAGMKAKVLWVKILSPEVYEYVK